MTNDTQKLQNLMQRVNISSFKALSRDAGVSERQILRLRQGKLEQMRVDVLLKLSQVFKISLNELLDTFSALPTPHSPLPSLLAIFAANRGGDRLFFGFVVHIAIGQFRHDSQIARHQALSSRENQPGECTGDNPVNPPQNFLPSETQLCPQCLVEASPRH